MNKKEFIEIVKPICLEMWHSPREINPVSHFTNMLVDKLLPEIDKFEQHIKDETMEWHKKNYVELFELCNKALNNIN